MTLNLASLSTQGEPGKAGERGLPGPPGAVVSISLESLTFLPLPVTYTILPWRMSAATVTTSEVTRGLCCVSEVQSLPAALISHTEFIAFSPQGPAGKDGEAGAQGAPGPAVSIPVCEPWGAGKVGPCFPSPWTIHDHCLFSTTGSCW